MTVKGKGTRLAASLCPVLLLASCHGTTAQPASSYCGVAFCVDDTTSSQVQKSSLAEDFNLYRIQWRGRIFVVYEGNDPQGGAQHIRTVASRFATAELGRGRDYVEVHVSTRARVWPQFVVVTTPCASDDCDIEEFVSLLRPR